MKNVKNAEVINKVIDPDLERRDILESEIPRDVLDILLKDRTTGKNILWMTDSYEHLESTFDIKMGFMILLMQIPFRARETRSFVRVLTKAKKSSASVFRRRRRCLLLRGFATT